MNLLRIQITFLLKLFVFFLLLSSLHPKVWAKPIFEFSPLFTSQEEYDDNIFRRRYNITSDLISTVSPGFTASLLHPRFNVELEYKTGFVYFRDNPELDYTEYDFTLDTTVLITPQLTFSLSESFLRSGRIETGDMPETDFERDVLRDSLEPFKRNLVSPQLEYRFGSENLVRLYYRNTDYTTKDPLEDDYTENFLQHELEYWFNAKNGISLLSNFTTGNFTIESDLLYGFNVIPRYRHRFNPRFEVYSEYGAGVADFDRVKIYGPLDGRRRYLISSEDLEDYNINQFRFGFVWQFKPDLQIEGNIGYFWKDGVGGRDDQGILSLLEIEKALRNLTLNLRWESGFIADYFSVRDSGFASFRRVSSDITYTYRERLELRVIGSYGFYDYSDQRDIPREILFGKREDDRYDASTQLRYHILQSYGFLSDLSLELAFNYSENDSNLLGEYYVNRRYIARITATF